MKKLGLLLLVIGLFVGFGYAGHQDKQEQLAQTTIDTCEQAQRMPDLPTDCLTLIKQVEADGHHEVLANAKGNYWIEER